MRLEGKTALIAGAGRNNGRQIALTFASQGADLVLVARQRREELEATAEACRAAGAKVTAHIADASDNNQVVELVRQSLADMGKIDVLVSTVGVRPRRPFWEVSVEEWHEVFNANLHAAFYLAKALTPHMMERRAGSIMALGGSGAHRAGDKSAAITASKHALYGLIRSIARELGPYNIRANLIALARIENERLNPEWYAGSGDANADTKDIPLRRIGHPREVANIALFLASDESSYTTGDSITCSGGILA